MPKTNTVVYTNSKHYQDIADAIRLKNGTENTYTPAQMAQAILALEAGEGPTVNNQNKTVTPSGSQKIITADSGYTGLGTVTVQGDADLIAGNIKSGVDIFGVTGTLTADYPVLTEAANSTGITANITTIEQPLELSVKNITTSGTYSASTDNVNGYSQIVVDAPIPTGTVISKVVGEGESISKNDFVTLNEDLWRYSANRPTATSQISICPINSNQNVGSIIFSHAGTATTQTYLEVFNVYKDHMTPVEAGIIITNVTTAYMYSNLVQLDENIVLYCSKYNNELRAIVRNWNSTPAVDSNYLSVATGSSPYPYVYNCCVKLTSTTALVVYPKSTGLCCNILTLNDNSLSKGTEVVLGPCATTPYIILEALDETTAIVGYRISTSNSTRTLNIIKIIDGTPTLIKTTYTTNSSYSSIMHIKKINSTSFLLSEDVNNIAYLRKYSFNGTSITQDSTLWSKEDNAIYGLVINDNNIAMLTRINNYLHFILLALDGTEIDSVILTPMITKVERYADLVYLKNMDCYVSAQTLTYAVDENLTTTVSLITWDGTELHYKNDYLESYNGESLYGIALEDGEAGDTIQVLIPTAPEEETEGE